MKRWWNPEPRSRWATWGPVVLLVLVNLAVGLRLAPHYGQSTDEAANILFAQGSLLSYQHPGEPYLDPTREDKGPFYLMLWVTGGELLDRVVPGWAFVDGRHFVNFLAFQLAVVSVYALAVRLTRPWAALAATLLFETQPLFFGHAFINQKDSPFMAFFAASMALGIYAVDGAARPAGRGAGQPVSDAGRGSFGEALRTAWARDPKGGRRAAIVIPIVALVVPVARLLLNAPVRSTIDHVVRAAYLGESWGPINALFRRLAENAGRVDPGAYVQRAGLFVDLGTILLSILMVMLAVAVGAALWPDSRRLGWPALRKELRQGVLPPFPWPLLAAAAVLGMAIAIRSAALYAGILLAGYALARAGPRIVLPLLAYFCVAALTAALLWPQLWVGPATLFAESLTKSIQFPELRRTLFDGVAILSDRLPREYLPKLMAIQFTLPAVILILLGLAVAVRRWLRGRLSPAFFWIVMLWILGPFFAVVVLGMPIYNYFRHVLFMMPPLFVLAALGIERALRPLRSRWAIAALVTICLLPGLVGIVRLHPYEYGYFNELVGGVRGAYGRYMSDYWCTSTREAMAFVNDYAPHGAGVAVSSATSNAVPFAREDLLVKDDTEIVTDGFEPALILGCSWATVNPGFYPEAPLLFQVEREGVPLVVVKLLRTPEPGEGRPAP